MNVIVTNKYRDIIHNDNFEIIKEINGSFEVSEIANNFNSFFYKKIIIDATALKRFPKEDVLRNLANSFDTSKLILFLPPDNPPPKKFLAFLATIKIYNFTDNVEGLLALINQSNTYEDVSDFISTNNQEEVTNLEFNEKLNQIESNKIILGIKDVTKEAGAVNLIYMLKKCLKEVYKKEVIGIEINKHDFMYYQDNDLYSLDKEKLFQFINIRDFDIMLLDLSNDVDSNICHDVLYLVEPSLYRINEAMINTRDIFMSLKGKKVVLNKNLLTDKDIAIFSREAGINIYFALPPLNDRINNPILTDLLIKLGLVMEDNTNTSKGLFDLFK